MKLIQTIAKFLTRLGVSADILTVLGLLLSFIAGCAVLQGHYFEAGLILLAAGALDMLDGAVARASGKATPFGGILDSSLDRYGDGFVLGGALVHFMTVGEWKYALFACSALIGSFSISYVRARAECEIEDCRVGFWERAERLVLIALALLFNRLEAGVCILGVATHWTVFQRMAYAKLRIEAPSRAVPPYLKPPSRKALAYYLKVSAILAILFLITL